MEIQSFLLAERVFKRGQWHDLRGAGIANFDCTPATEFPARHSLAAFILLCRESCDGEAPWTLCFTLVDEDGEPAGQPNHLVFQASFPAGKWTYRLDTTLHFEFPGPGRYRLDITPDEGLAGDVYHYNISVTEVAE